MTPDDFPDVTPTNRYHTPRPKEAFGSIADASLGSSGEAEEELQPTMQLRCELEITNTGESSSVVMRHCTFGHLLRLEVTCLLQTQTSMTCTKLCSIQRCNSP